MNIKYYKSSLALALVLLTLLSQNVFSYTKLIVAETALESPPNDWSASDDASLNVNIGFTFPFGSAGDITSIRINSNGALNTSATSWTAYSNNVLSDSSVPAYAIAPYWDDINRTNGGTIKYGTLGSAPNRHFVVAWTDTPRYPNVGSCTFQVVLYENGDIRFRYSTGNDQCGGESATVGIKESSSAIDQHSYNTAIDLSKDILYTDPKPQISLQKTLETLSDPINGTTNPKAIPGAISEYTLKAENSGNGTADNNSIVLSDKVPANTILYVNDISGSGSGPVRFVDGSPSSGLSYNFVSLSSTTDNLSFSNDNGSSYNYTPTPDAYGFDSSVTNVKISTTGSFLGDSGSGAPNFQLMFRVKVE